MPWSISYAYCRHVLTVRYGRTRCGRPAFADREMMSGLRTGLYRAFGVPDDDVREVPRARTTRAATAAIWYAESVPDGFGGARKQRRYATNMGLRVIRVIAFLALLLCAGGAYYWFRVRQEGRRPAFASAPIAQPTGLGGAAHEIPNSASPSPSSAVADPAAVEARKYAELWHSGEVLEFSANVAKLNNVASLRVLTGERQDFLGKTVWHMQAVAHTENPLRMVFALDDQFDSYSDGTSMASVQYEMHLNERGQKVDSVQRMTATGREAAPANVTEARVLAGTRDPLGMLQYLRSVDWSKTPEVRSPVYDGHKLYDVRAREESVAEAVSVPAGNFRASKITLRVFDNGVEMKDAAFALYLANNAWRTPVLIEAVIPVATARVELVKFSRPGSKY